MSWTGSFRRIKITLNSAAVARIAKLDYRQGYYAGKQFNKSSESDKERQLAQALMLGDPVTDMDLAMELDYFRLAHDRYFVPMAAKIPGSEMELARHGGADTTRHRFHRRGEGSKGAVVANVRDSTIQAEGRERRQQLAKTPLEYDTGFTLPPGDYTVSFWRAKTPPAKWALTRSSSSIPDLTNEQKHLPISSVVLSSQRDKLDAAVFTRRKRQEDSRGATR